MNKTTKGILLVSSTAIISGIAIFINSLFVLQINPTAYTFMKNGIAALAIFLIILAITQFRKQPEDPVCLRNLNKSQWLKLFIIGIIGGGIPFILFFEGLAQTTGPAGSFIHKSMFIYIAILAVIFLKEKISPFVLPAGLIILAGTFLLLKTEIITFNTGNLMILGATLIWSVENILAKKFLKDIHPIPLAFGRMGFGLIILFGYTLFTGHLADLKSLTLYQFAWSIITTAFLTGYMLTWFYGLRLIPVSLASTILVISAPITYALNLIFLQKPISLLQAIGLLMICAGVGIWGYFSGKKAYSEETGESWEGA